MLDIAGSFPTAIYIIIHGIVVGAQAYASGFYGEGFGPILLDYVQCGGNEAALLDCSHTNHSQCDHSFDAGVACYIGEDCF